MKIINHASYIDASNVFRDPELVKQLGVSGSFNREHYSSSFIKQWEQCPAKLLLDNVTESVPNQAIRIGLIVHKLLEEHYKLGRSEQETLDIVSKDRSANFFDLCKAKQYLKAYFSMKPYVEGITQCDSYCEELFLTKARPFGVQLPAPIKAFVDRIDITNKGTFIIDYKTTSREPEQDQHVDQMIIYKWAVEEEWGLKVEDAYVASIYEPDPRYLKQSITDIKESMLVDKIFKTDEEVCASMETRCYQKNRGQWCNWCPLKQACEIDSEMIIEEKAEEQTNGTNK